MCMYIPIPRWEGYDQIPLTGWVRPAVWGTSQQACKLSIALFGIYFTIRTYSGVRVQPKRIYLDATLMPGDNTNIGHASIGLSSQSGTSAHCKAVT